MAYTLRKPNDFFSDNPFHQDAVINKVDEIIYQAITRNASDIHLQPYEDCLVVRYRIDGILYDEESLTQEHLAIISRVKILANLDIAQQRIPQDGKIKINFEQGNARIVDIRVATCPSIHGEKVVLRILDRSYGLRSLHSIGFSDIILEHINAILKRPHGFFLVTGPTGSGKTTTLYAMLSSLNRAEKNIITMEDPVEYEIQGVTQSNVNAPIGFVFQTGLRALLRQDPDIMMIGEIRDQETVKIAIEAALTGHLVFSTLHTNDAPGAVVRLLDMGVEPFLISASLSGVLAQRLARILCQHCKEAQTLSPSQTDVLKKLNVTLEQSFVARGCTQCHHLGYKGRVGIFELLVISETMKELIHNKAAPKLLYEQATKDGMINLLSDGITKVNAGIISLDELLGIVFTA